MATLQEYQATHHDKAPPQVLIMEDDLTVSRGLEMVLTEDGYEVFLAGTGKLALEAFERGRYDLLVADLRLPDIDGMDVIERVRGENPDTEVIVITGYGTAERAVKAMKMGVHDFLAKPFTEEQIKTAITDALQKHVERPAEALVTRAETEEEKLIQKRQVIEVLNRTAEDLVFWQALMAKGSGALADYRLSGEAKAAIASGDLRWINENVGELTQKQLMFIYKRMEREAW